MSPRRYIRAISVAGSDSGGGAGIQGDLKTFSALGVYGSTVITALTAQNTVEVRSISEVSPSFVRDQLDAVLADIGTDAVKIGMLLDAKIIETVVDRLDAYGICKVILDPVMIAKGGDRLLKVDAVDALMRLLVPRAEILTPNLPEAELLLGRPLHSPASIENGAKELSRLGPAAVLIKGGHASNSEYSRDCLVVVRPNRDFTVHWLSSPRIVTKNTHGTGCTLSAAICAFRAQGHDIDQAVVRAKTFLNRALVTGAEYSLGYGHGPVCHFGPGYSG